MNDSNAIDLNAGRPSTSERIKRTREVTRAAQAEFEQGPPKLYRNELFRAVQNARYGSNVSRLGVREIAADCRLSVGTVTDALAGNASKIETLWKLCRYFGVPWFVLFDPEMKTYLTQVREDGTGVDWKLRDDIATPETASRSREVPAVKIWADRGGAVNVEHDDFGSRVEPGSTLKIGFCDITVRQNKAAGKVKK